MWWGWRDVTLYSFPNISLSDQKVVSIPRLESFGLSVEILSSEAST